VSRDFELGRNLSGDFRKSLTYLLLLVIWVCLSDDPCLVCFPRVPGSVIVFVHI